MYLKKYLWKVEDDELFETPSTCLNAVNTFLYDIPFINSCNHTKVYLHKFMRSLVLLRACFNTMAVSGVFGLI